MFFSSFYLRQLIEEIRLFFYEFIFEIFLYIFLCASQIDRDGSGYIELAELKQALDVCGFKIPQWKVRQMIDEYDRDESGPGKGRLSFDEFESVRWFYSFIYLFIYFIYRFF